MRAPCRDRRGRRMRTRRSLPALCTTHRETKAQVPSMITVSRVFIRKPVAEVFDFVADFEQEPQWNPSLVSLHKTSPGPVGVGTMWEERVGLRRVTLLQRRRTVDYQRDTAVSF